MLETADLTKKITKKEYQNMMADLQIKLGELQRRAKQMDMPVTLVFEGWGAAGKGVLLNEFIQALDPRGFSVYPMGNPTEAEALDPYLRRYWLRIPPKGRMAIFDQSWYRRVLKDREEKLIVEGTWRKAYYEINSFERQLTDDGHVLLKFFLHISKAEQKKRLKKIAQNAVTAWRVTDSDWRQHKQYAAYLEAVEEMIEKTDTHYAPWIFVEAQDKDFAIVKVYKKVIEALENKISQLGRQKGPKNRCLPAEGESIPVNAAILANIDLTKTVSKKIYKAELAGLQARMRELAYILYHRKMPLIIVYEGWDAAGKGSNIKRLTQTMDPRGYKVIPVSAPNEVERAQHYLWRFWREMPPAGKIAIFDRSWYGRVLVERVERFCSEEEWKRAYREINEMEEQLIAAGAIVLKFWLHIDQAEQLRRFEERSSVPHKQWKITGEDWRNREQWGQYQLAVEEMIFRTSTTYAPWTIVEGNSKYYARIKVLKTVIEAIEKAL